MKKLRVLFTGGGTGGHIYPIVAVATRMRDWAVRNGFEPDFRYFGQPGNYAEILKAEGIRISTIATSKLRRYFSLLNVLDFFKFFFGFFQGLWKLYWFMPDVMFSKGGPGALSVVFAGRFYLIPLVIHESDAIPGLTNKVSARFARIVDLSFTAAANYFSKIKAKVVIVGNPTRPEFLTGIPEDQAKKNLGFDPQKPVLLFLAGSQGSNRMNDFVIGNLEALLLKFQIIHSVGREKFKEYKDQYDFITKNYSPVLTQNYKFSDYLDNVSLAMDAADLVISRGGAGAIFEIAGKGKPSIIVPFPEAASDHQRENAYAYEETGATIVIEQENLLPSIFIGQVEKIFGSADLWKKMSGAAHDFATPQAADKIASDVLSLWQV
jgi:UDP-N-acetylglucosamine--N-acetylmuramyl-(pentapeptide) pyrophosphoryl-undecaprenol N-acetylglucosamine transferase